MLRLIFFGSGFSPAIGFRMNSHSAVTTGKGTFIVTDFHWAVEMYEGTLWMDTQL